MYILRAILLFGWIAVVYVTVVATSAQGIPAATNIFSSDMADLGWRAQFNTDLLLHMLLAGLWVAWRQKFSITGIILGLICCFSGSLFTYAYLLGLSVYHRGDMKKLALGKHIEELAASNN